MIDSVGSIGTLRFSVCGVTGKTDNSEPKFSPWADRVGSQRISSWLLSAVVHLIALLLLALLTRQLGDANRGVALRVGWSSGDKDRPLQILPMQTSTKAAESDAEESPVRVEMPVPQSGFAEPQSLATSDSRNIDDQIAAALLSGGSPADRRDRVYVGGGGMESRTPAGRIKYGELYGATAESEQAVERALRWLAEHQRGDGSWSFDLGRAPCEGRCRDGRPAADDTPTPKSAATGLALLAFLGAGYTPHEGPYQETVAKGLYYLRSCALETASGYDWQLAGSMYGHGIAMLALSEALGMTKLQDQYDTDLLHYVSEGARFTTNAQHSNGSWGYIPGSPGDTTITGWQVLSLVGAVKAGVTLKSQTFRSAEMFLMSVRDEPSYRFGYKSPKAEPTTTAIALTLLIYLGQHPGYTPFDLELDKIVQEGPTLTNVYHDYYATLALHHFRHRDWDRWNKQLRDHLVNTQATRGHEAGSWHFADRWGSVGGRLYTTAMCTLILEVYYRYLPLYAEPPEFPL